MKEEKFKVIQFIRDLIIDIDKEIVISSGCKK